MFSTTDDEGLLRLVTAVKSSGYNFITVTPATHGQVNSRPENRWARSLRDVLGWSRPFHGNASIVPDDLFDLMRNAQILIPTEDQTADTPNSVFFGPDTYRFARAIRAAISARDLSAYPVHRAIDIGCGAGPGAILLAKAYRSAEIFASDINEAALRFTDINARLAGVRVRSVSSNLLDDVQGQFDMIICNPPYLVDSSRRQYRHGGGALGSGLSVDIVRAACRRLSDGGTLVLYTGSAIIDGQDLFREEATDILKNSGLSWTYEEIDPDVFAEELTSESYGHADRIAAVVLTATRTKSS